MQLSAERSAWAAYSSPASSASHVVLPRHRYVHGSSIRNRQYENRGGNTLVCQSAQGNGEEEMLTKGIKPIVGKQLPNQAETLFAGSAEEVITLMPETDKEEKPTSDLDYLTELLAIQQNDGPKDISFLGTRNMGVTHQKLVEILSYAYASAGNHIYTSGSIGTNAAVIKGALRANMPDKLTVILPQSLSKQPSESQELLQQVKNWKEMPENDHLSLLEASRICNRRIVSNVQQVICFAFHDSRLLLETCHHAKDLRKIVTMFYLD
ncbi:hypothetical protein DUNSADRAFT_10405 [Dunaliella salina]|uniref:Uncharacterized protein n=1 Tax=Dunaliella salina TaxID=3046 RepID=A0ABQ7GFE5_DUNSA|nr:hypothetical protein DUNSADRAFT_10405 [Dunaliella salina]|eukprot:KAF5833324.1 hypothetical protein DUNSADRAFT_10405 [Dunaliella salina]